MNLLSLIDRILAGKALSAAEALLVYEKMPLSELGHLAHVRKSEILSHPEAVTYILDRNINYTNICNADCIFCAFYRAPGARDGYVLSEAELYAKIEETLAKGGHQILLQGGHNPALGIDYYENLFRGIKQRFDIKLHALSPSEVIHICEMSHLTVDEVLRRLIATGLDSIPGGGAEILVDRVRKRLMRHKCTSDQWLEVMEKAHRLGLRTTATMMFGHVERLEDRIEHLLKLQSLQEKTGGFTAFISWTFQKQHTGLEKGEFYVSPNEYLRVLALSRILLRGIQNIQVSFVTMGQETATLGLAFGGNDYGSVMMEENVVRAAGAENPMTEEDIQQKSVLPATLRDDEICNTNFCPNPRALILRMQSPIKSACNAISLTTGSTSRGALLVHGFTASPGEMLELGEFLQAAGFHVEIPLLPGHGTLPEDLNRVTDEDWLVAVRSAYQALALKCSEVFLCGLSLGAMLCLHLAAETSSLAGIVGLSTPYWIRNPCIHRFLSFASKTGLWTMLIPSQIPKNLTPLPVERFVYPFYPSSGLRSLVRLIDRTKPRLPEIRSPVLLVHSKVDSLIPFSSMQAIAHKLPQIPEMLALEQSDHVITCDRERNLVFRTVLQFMNQHGNQKDGRLP